MILEDMDTLILAQGHKADCDLLSVCEAAGLPVTGIGDCLAPPRTAEEAVLEGLRAVGQSSDRPTAPCAHAERKTIKRPV